MMIPDLGTLKMVSGHIKQQIENIGPATFPPILERGKKIALQDMLKWLTEQIDQRGEC